MSDRVELTGPEKREFERQYRHALRGRIELEGLTFPPTPQLLRSVESIVAARVAALTAERDEALTVIQGYQLGLDRDQLRRERDAARAELAAANARCAELEAAVEQEITTRDQYADLLDRFAAAIPGDHGEHSSSNDPWTNALASAAALQETLDRVTALAAEWETRGWDVEGISPAGFVSDLRAALRKPRGLDSRGRSILNPNYGIDDEGGASDEHR